MPLDNPSNINQQAGMGLIESLIALLVISIGLMGIAALQITSLKQSSIAQWHSQAVWYSYEMTDRIVANRSAFIQYNNIDTNTDYSQDCQAAPCSVAQMVTADAQAWKELISTLPEGRGIISSPDANTLTISVMWDEDIELTNCTFTDPDPTGMTCYTVTTIR